MIKKSLLALSLGGFGIGITEFVMMGLLPDIAKDLSIDIPTAGHLISSYALGVVVGAPVLVMFSSKFAPHKLLMGLMVLFTIFNGLSILVPSYNMFLLTRFLSGLPHGAFFGVGSVVASRIADRGKEAQAVSVMFAGLTIANLIGVPLGTYLGHEYSWRYTFALITLIGILTFLAILLWMPRFKQEEKAENQASQWSFFKRFDSWLLMLIIAIGTGGLFCWISYIAPLMTKVAGFPESSVSYIMVLAGLGMFFGNIIGGKMADKMSPAKAVLINFSLMVICLVIVHFVSHSQIMALIMTLVTGIISFTTGTPLQMLMIYNAKGSEMLAAGISQASFNLGNAMGAFFAGLPLVYGLDFTYPSLVGAVMAACGSLLVFYFIQRQKKQF